MDELKYELKLSKLNVGKSIGPDEIHPKILKYLWSNESKLSEKCIEYENSPLIKKKQL